MRSKQSSLVRQKHLKRIALVQQKMRQAEVQLCLFNTPCDLFYLTGLQLSAGRLLVHLTHTQLFVDGRYLSYALAEAPVPAALEEEAPLRAWFKKCRGKKWAFDSRHVSYEQFLKLQALTDKLKLPYTLVPLPAFFQSLRLIKEKEEIARLCASARLLYRGFKYLRERLKKGVTEVEIARAFEIFCLQQGAEKLAFESIIAFGANSARPHHRAGKRRLHAGDIVLIDIGVVLDGYNSDMTRTLFFGAIEPFFKRVYDVVYEAQRAALALCRPGTCVGKLDEAARAVMRAHEMEAYFTHSLGHGIGLEVHEAPRIKYNGEDKDLVLESGMVITVEPGLYFPERGGVRYEDTIAITPQGHKNFYTTMQQYPVLRAGRS